MKKLPLVFLILASGLSLYLCYLLLFGAPWSSFRAQGALLLDMVWGKISLVDLYAGFMLALCFVWLFEPRRIIAVVVTILLPLLGNPVVVLWSIARLPVLLKSSTHYRLHNDKL